MIPRRTFKSWLVCRDRRKGIAGKVEPFVIAELDGAHKARAFARGYVAAALKKGASVTVTIWKLCGLMDSR